MKFLWKNQTLAALFLGALLAGCETDSAPKKASVVPHFESVILSASKHSGTAAMQERFGATWQPSVAEVKQAFSKLPYYLENSPDVLLEFRYYERGTPTLQKTLADKVCQVLGVTVDGRKQLLFNFLVKETDASKGWRDAFVTVHEGGAAYWKVYYDIETGQFGHLEVNHTY